MFEFVSHQFLNEDNYTKEIVYLLLDKKYRVAFVRKEMKNGMKFWAPISCAAVLNGQKTYFQSFLFDSSFLEKDIKAYLESRVWEREQPKSQIKENQMDMFNVTSECPF